MIHSLRAWRVALYLGLITPSWAWADPRPEPHAISLSAHLELGGVIAPERGVSEQERLPWRARETHALFPARVMGSARLKRGPWLAQSTLRLYAQPLWQGSPQASSYQDPLGSNPALNELSLSYTRKLTTSLSLSAGAGRWTPGVERAPVPWSLEANERLWSRAPDPRDRAVSGLFLILKPDAERGASAWLPRALHLELFTPSLELTPGKTARRLALRSEAVWRYAHLSALNLEAGRVEGGSSWARLGYELSAALDPAEQPAHSSSALRYRGALLYRSGPSAPLAYVEATQASIGGYGDGLVASHTLSKGLGRASLGLGYAWRDPQLEFAYNAQHSLSIFCHIVVYAELSVYLEHRHLWSASDNRLSFGSDLTFIQLNWSPKWDL